MDIFLYLLIRLWFVWIDEKYFAIGSSEVHINGNITAEVNSNDIRLECSFTLGEGDALYSTALTAENETKDEFLEIAGYLRNTKLLFTSFGMDLFGNETTLIHFDETQNVFKFAFDNVTCRHERRYKCFLYVTSSSGVLPRLFESDAIWISVTVPPSKPEMNLPTKVNDLSGGNRNKRSATITPKNDTREQDFLEGDNITFMCEGDVGRPEGSIEWQKIYANDENLTFSNTITETIPESCSNEGNSTLTMQVTGDDNQAIIRCIVKSEVSHVFLYDDSEPLRIQFQVRIPVIELQPDKTVFPEGDSVQLKCQSAGNPSPSYSWLKGNGSNETILAYTDSFVIENSNITDSGLYTCYTNNSIDGNVYKAFNSIYISIENTNDLSEDKNNSSENNHNILIGIGIAGGFLIFAVFIASAIYGRRAKRKRLLKGKGKTTSKSFSENCAKNNPCYTSDSGTRSNDNLNDSGNAMATRNDKLENKEKLIGKLRNKDIELANSTKQTNNEAASYAYVTISSDYHAEKETKFDSYEKFKPSTINEKNIPFTTASSQYAKENLNENSSDHYASSVPDVYDVLHDNRYKTEGDAYDRMSELKRLPENGRKSNKSITNQDKTMIGSLPIHLENSRLGGYESVVIDVDKPVISSGNNEYGHADPETIRDHNTEYMHNQKQEENKMNKSPIPNHTAEYAQVNEATKIKNKTKNNDKDKDQTTVEVSARTQEGVNCNSEDRPPEIMDQFDTPNSKNTGRDESESSNKSSQIERNNTQPFVNGVGKEKGKVAIVLPIIGSSVESEGDTLKENTNAEVQQEIEDRSGQRVDNAQSFGTNNQKNQQTNSDPKSSFKYNQTGPQNNQAFESEEYQQVDSVLLDSIEDNGSKQ